MSRLCLQCDRSFEPNAPHQVFDSQECRYQGWIEKEILAAQGGAQRVEAHPLVAARAEQEESATNKRYGLLIRQAIIDQLKTVGTCHADDLEALYPADELARKRCRKLAGAQFGSMAAPRGGREPLIREKERRKSSIPERKGAKSGVYVFTKAGWDRWGAAGVGGGNVSESSAFDPDASATSPHSGETGLTGPGSGAGEASSLPVAPGSVVEPPATSTGSPDQPLTGVNAGRPSSQGEEGLEETQEPAGVHSGEDPEPVPLPGFEESAAAQHMKDAA